MQQKNPVSKPIIAARDHERLVMVRTQIRERGISNERVLSAMEQVQRHLFVPDNLQDQAYADHPLPIGHNQTISQPYIVALMTELIDPTPGQTILEIGTGSGYQAAVLARTGAEVITLERLPEVADLAMSNLERAEIADIRVIVADGSLGWPEKNPYSGILITAATPRIPPPLIAQLADGGSLVAPVGSETIQELIRITRIGAELHEERYGAVRFVPLIGCYGWCPSS
ncbi:MAG TPA: protein-L-isoaspartate(D-aspartate) O-methyltransferase [Methanospirillum sp.]|nr:protein-L-isoaspartate(D-aspartate) O-methyltransferase [Methanospirillum sp.]